MVIMGAIFLEPDEASARAPRRKPSSDAAASRLMLPARVRVRFIRLIITSVE